MKRTKAERDAALVATNNAINRIVGNKPLWDEIDRLRSDLEDAEAEIADRKKCRHVEQTCSCYDTEENP